MKKSQSRKKPKPKYDQTTNDKEAVDGILVRIDKKDFTVIGEHPDHIQELPGYKICIAILGWDKNRNLLNSIKKAHLAQEKLHTKLQGGGASRSLMIQCLEKIDKVIATNLRAVSQRIQTRRWRERKRGDLLDLLKEAFRSLEKWTAKTTHYCQLAEQCVDPSKKEILKDAASLGILKTGEFINQIEQMQHGFWDNFSAVHFLDMRNKRNLIGHTDNLAMEDVISLGTGIVRDLQVAIQRTLFPQNANLGQDRFLMSAEELRNLKPARLGEKSAPDNSIAMIHIDEHNRFVINRAGRSKNNKLLISSSITGSTHLTIDEFRSDPRSEPGLSTEQR